MRRRRNPDDPALLARVKLKITKSRSRVDVRAYLPAKRASLRAHASQASADGSVRTLAVLTRMPGPLQTMLLGTEYYVSVSDPQAARTSSTASSES